MCTRPLLWSRELTHHMDVPVADEDEGSVVPGPSAGITHGTLNIVQYYTSIVSHGLRGESGIRLAQVSIVPEGGRERGRE